MEARERKPAQGRPAHRGRFARLMRFFLAVLIWLAAWDLPFANTRAAAAFTPASTLGNHPEAWLDPRLQEQLAATAGDEMRTVIILLKNALDPMEAGLSYAGLPRQEQVIRRLQSQAEASQSGMKTFLQDPRFRGKIGKTTHFWIINGLAIQATPDVILALAARPDVDAIVINEGFRALAPETASGPAWDNLGKINAPLMWAAGFRGQGVVVANMDTGVDYTHPELTAQWRGGSNSWFDPADPAGAHPTPADLSPGCVEAGHGTATMGILAGNTIGVAPQAKWIAVKIFSDSTDPLTPCQATTATITAGFQWLLDPDGNPATPDAPQVVNNSWGGSSGVCASSPTVNHVFEPEMQALRAAGILPIFAAGNSGPASGTGVYPAIYPEAFPVGATDSLDAIASYSSRGPNNCITPPALFPEIVAPGTNIKVPAPGGIYTVLSGTSFAAPHAAGALALLLSAFPQGLTLQQQETALQHSAVDLGTPGPDTTFGMGRLDVWGAYHQYNDSQVGFTLTQQTVKEGTGIVSVFVTRSGGLSKPQESVDYSLAPGGAARPGVDVQFSPGTLVFLPGETSKSFPITILRDGLPGANKTLTLVLGNPITALINTSAAQMTLTVTEVDPWKYYFPRVGAAATIKNPLPTGSP